MKEFKELEKLKEAIIEDNGYFNYNADCNNCEYNANCKKNSNYCETYSWIVNKATEYEKKLQIKKESLLEIWEKKRDYWYPNYYQNNNFPSIEKIDYIIETIAEYHETFKKGFVCPFCKEVSTSPFKCDSGKIVKTIDGKTQKCNWNSGGLFRTLGKGKFIFIKELAFPIEIFPPVE